MKESYIAHSIDTEYRRKKYYEYKRKSKKKSNAFMNNMVDDFIEDMKNEENKNCNR